MKLLPDSSLSFRPPGRSCRTWLHFYRFSVLQAEGEVRAQDTPRTSSSFSESVQGGTGPRSKFLDSTLFSRLGDDAGPEFLNRVRKLELLLIARRRLPWTTLMIAVPFLRLPSLRLLASRLLLWPSAWPPLSFRVLCLSPRVPGPRFLAFLLFEPPSLARLISKDEVSEATVPNSDDRRGGTCVELLHVLGAEGFRSARGVLRVYSGGVEAAHVTAGENQGITGLPQVSSLEFP